MMPLIIDDSKPIEAHNQAGRLMGLVPRKLWYGATPECVAEAEPGAIYPMEEWPDRIADMERRLAFAYHFWKDSPIETIDQDGIGYCHACSPAFDIMLVRWMVGLPHVELSAGSIGGPITGYRNRGAWIMDDLEQIVKFGVASTDFVPMMQVSRAGWKPGAEENALLHTCDEWLSLGERNFLQHGSRLLDGKGVCVGLNYWGHAVTDVRLVDAVPKLKATDHNRYRVGFVNSWGPGWGENGYAERADSKKFADEAYVPTVAKASEK